MTELLIILGIAIWALVIAKICGLTTLFWMIAIAMLALGLFVEVRDRREFKRHRTWLSETLRPKRPGRWGRFR